MSTTKQVDTQSTPPALASAVQLLSPGRIGPSLSNPRKHFDAAKLQELAQSIQAHGVVQPLVVRPSTTWFIDPGVEHTKAGQKPFWQVLDRRRLDKAKGKYDGTPEKFSTEAEAQANLPRFELVCGERRWRAARLAGVATVPCLVRELDDKAVLEIQVIENLQRADVHPIEEADGYDQLMFKHAYTMADLVSKVGKSKEYIYGRLKLRALCGEAREAFYAGKLSASVALLVARIPVPELQKQALAAFKDEQRYDDDRDEPLTFRRAARLIQDRFMLQLKEAPFDTAAADLPGGACAACPKRTGNQRDLFADVKSADVCTDPRCFAAKKKAWAERQRAALALRAKKEGLDILSPEETAQALRTSWNGEMQGRFDDISKKCEADPKGRTYERLLRDLGPTAPKVVGAIDDHGQIRRLVPRAEVTAALKAVGLGVAKHSAAGQRIEMKRDSLKRERAEELREAEVGAVTAALVAKVEHLGPARLPDSFWRAVGAGAAEGDMYDSSFDLIQRRKIGSLRDLCGLFAKATPGFAVGALAEMFICSDEDLTSQVAKALKLDITAIAKAARAPLEAKHKTADAKKAAASIKAKAKTPKTKAGK